MDNSQIIPRGWNMSFFIRAFPHFQMILLSSMLASSISFIMPQSNHVILASSRMTLHALPLSLFDEISTTDMMDLPIYNILDSIRESVKEKPNLLLEASPGAGKTTIVPLLISSLEPSSPNGNGDTKKSQTNVIVIEPRRVATRSAAQRMSKLINQSPGGSVGYAMRGESKQSSNTQVMVMTDGVLLNMLRDDPELKGYDAVILDEFHERGVGSDTALALLREVQVNYRPDLKLIVMSATLLGNIDGNEENANVGTKLMRVLGGESSCNVLRSDGRQYPITIQHAQRSSPLHGALLNDSKLLIKTMADAIEQGLLKAPNRGDILAFLPGAKEIRKTVQELRSRGFRDVDIYPLYGALPKADQDKAIYKGDSDRRRVIISSPISEASLTIEAITCVVDSGLRRVPRYDGNTGLPRLVTVSCSQDSVIQRAGRAGRTQEGHCIRLFTESEFNRFPEQASPEIRDCDLVPTALLLSDWGCTSADEILEDLPFLDPPPRDHLAFAYNMLVELNALEEYKTTNSRAKRYRITDHGKALSRLATHPRFATCIIKASEAGMAQLAAAVTVAALLDEELVSRQRQESDLTVCVRDVLNEGPSSFNGEKLLNYASRVSDKAHSAVFNALTNSIPVNEVSRCVGQALLPGFIDLVAQRKGDASYGGSMYMLSLGRSARLDGKQDSGEYIIVADTFAGDDGKNRIRAFGKIDVPLLEEFSSEKDEVYTVASKGYEVRARRVTKVGSLVLSSLTLPSPNADEVTDVLVDVIDSLGGVPAALIPLQTKKDALEFIELRQRIKLARSLSSDVDWPPSFSSLDAIEDGHGSSKDEEAMIELIEPWLAVAASLKGVNLLQIFKTSLTLEHQNHIDKYFPTTIKAPDGSGIPVSYSDGTANASGKLQQFFGQENSPSVGPPGNKVNVTLSLLSPSGKLLAQTIDIPFFWSETYPSVRSEMRGRYPKHPWPEDPMTATASRLTKKQQEIRSPDVGEEKVDKRKERNKQKKKR